MVDRTQLLQVWLKLLFIRLALFFVYASTLTSMYFPYALIIILSSTELHINVQPFKKTTVSWYSSGYIDLVFLFLICMMYILVVGTNTESMLEHIMYLLVMVILGF